MNQNSERLRAKQPSDVSLLDLGEMFCRTAAGVGDADVAGSEECADDDVAECGKARGQRGAADAYLTRAPLCRWLGTVSYSVYLMHTTVQAVVEPSIHRAVESAGVPDAKGVEVACLVAVVLPVATLTYLLVEKPGRRVLRRRLDFGQSLPRTAMR